MIQIVSTLDRQDAADDDARVRGGGSAAVLVAVELSKSSEAALRCASGYAKTVGARLEVLHVVHDPADSPGTYKPDDGDPLEPIADVARRRLDEFLDRVGREDPRLSGLGAAKRLCVEGLPAPKILGIAEARGARLLVLGGRRRNGLERLMHGSTALQIARDAELPVTVVKSDD